MHLPARGRTTQHVAKMEKSKIYRFRAGGPFLAMERYFKPKPPRGGAEEQTPQLGDTDEKTPKTGDTEEARKPGSTAKTPKSVKRKHPSQSPGSIASPSQSVVYFTRAASRKEHQLALLQPLPTHVFFCVQIESGGSLCRH